VKHFLWHGWLLAVLLAAGEAQEKFTDRLSAEEKKAMGLELLSPEQVAALNAAVQRDRQQGAVQVREQTKAELREEVKAQVKAEVKQQAKAEVRTELQKQREAETRVLSRVLGKYSGWDGATQFKLENGQIWRQAEPAVFYTKPVENAAVLIEKVYGGWRLYDQGGGWVRVVRIK
jgi:hypothetical protein